MKARRIEKVAVDNASGRSLSAAQRQVSSQPTTPRPARPSLDRPRSIGSGSKGLDRLSGKPSNLAVCMFLASVETVTSRTPQTIQVEHA
ncbi:hypothetical protein ABW21_db0204444 [Orbilia brochopaga]|nr:hypothetical protein ABW21_db0204444 [Drechslerella brochopaga]